MLSDLYKWRIGNKLFILIKFLNNPSFAIQKTETTKLAYEREISEFRVATIEAYRTLEAAGIKY